MKCDKCHHYERPSQVCNLCRKGQIVKLEAQLADVYKEYQDIAGIHSAMCTAKDKRIAELEERMADGCENCMPYKRILRREKLIADLERALWITRGRLKHRNMSTLVIDGVLDKKGD